MRKQSKYSIRNGCFSFLSSLTFCLVALSLSHLSHLSLSLSLSGAFPRTTHQAETQRASERASKSTTNTTQEKLQPPFTNSNFQTLIQIQPLFFIFHPFKPKTLAPLFPPKCRVFSDSIPQRRIVFTELGLGI